MSKQKTFNIFAKNNTIPRGKHAKIGKHALVSDKVFANPVFYASAAALMSLSMVAPPFTTAYGEGNDPVVDLDDVNVKSEEIVVEDTDTIESLQNELNLIDNSIDSINKDIENYENKINTLIESKEKATETILAEDKIKFLNEFVGTVSNSDIQIQEYKNTIENERAYLNELQSKRDIYQSKLDDKILEREIEEAAKAAEAAKYNYSSNSNSGGVYYDYASDGYMGYNEFKRTGRVSNGDYTYTWYSESVKPGGGLNIPGRNTTEGCVRDADGYIVVAANPDTLSYGDTVDTPLGPGKVYDTGCASGTIDIYLA